MNTATLPELISRFLNEDYDLQSFRNKLLPVVQELLMNNTAALYQALYRIDVSEQKVKKVFEDNPLVEIAAQRITELIIERQIEKVQWRKKYRS